MFKTLEHMIDYFYIGIAPNTFGTYFLSKAITNAAEDQWGLLTFNIFNASANYYVGFIKYAEYRDLKQALEKRGWDERLVKQKAYSFCQRHAARQAAKQTNSLSRFDEFMKQEGHKWYHLLPKLHRIHELYR